MTDLPAIEPDYFDDAIACKLDRRREGPSLARVD